MADGKLKKIAVTGGPPVTVCESGSRGDGAWSRSGVIIYEGSTTDSIMRVAASGGVPRPATRLDRSRGEVGNAWPQFLPDGRHFLYLGLGVRPDSVALKVGALDSKETKIVAIGSYSRIEYAPPGYVLFVRDRALMAQPFDANGLKLAGEPFPVIDDVSAGGGGASNADFSLSENGVLVCRGGSASGNSKLVWTDRSGRELGVLGAPAEYPGVTLSPDGTRAAAAIGDFTRSDIWILDRARGVTTRLTFDPGGDIWPVWSPDGSRIAFGSNRDGRYALFERQSDGLGEDRLLLRCDLDCAPVDWSLDGRYIVYVTSGGSTRWDVWVLPTFGDRKPIHFLRSQFSEFEPKISPDSRWIAYSSNESGRREIHGRRELDRGAQG